MKKILFVIMILSSQAHASWFSDAVKKIMSPELSLVKVEAAKNADALAKLYTQVDANFNLQNQMIANIKTDIRTEMKAELKSQAQAGANNRIESTSVGGNQSNQSTVNNDSEVLKELLFVFKAIIIFLIGQLCAILGLFVKKDWDLQKRMEESRERADKRRDDAQIALDKIQMEMLNKVIK